jgi:hypothetical protein
LDTINGSFYNLTFWGIIDDDVNGSFYNTSNVSHLFNINLFVINPNPGNGTHGTNYLKMNASGLTTSVDVTCINFTTPPALIPGSASYEFDSESRSNGACMWNTSAVYNDAWANATGSVAPGPLYVGQYEMAGDYTITRSYLIFNTSGLPDEAVIDSAYVSLVLFSDHSAVDFNVVLQQVKPPAPHAPLTPGDYNKGNFPPSATYANENISGFTDDDRFNLSLNASGIAEIDAAGYTYFVIRSDQDLIASAPGVGSDEWVMFYAPGGVIPEYAPHLIINYTIPSSNWQHIVNLTSYTNESGAWVAYNTTHVYSNGTVTVPAAWADSNNTYYWVCEWESNGTNIGASDVWSFETVNITGGGGGGILPIGGVGDASMNYLLLVAIGSFSICMIFFNRKKRKK